MPKPKSKTIKTMVGYVPNPNDWYKDFTFHWGELHYPFACKEPNLSFKKWTKIQVTIEEVEE